MSHPTSIVPNVHTCIVNISFPLGIAPRLSSTCGSRLFWNCFINTPSDFNIKRPCQSNLFDEQMYRSLKTSLSSGLGILDFFRAHHNCLTTQTQIVNAVAVRINNPHIHAGLASRLVVGECHNHQDRHSSRSHLNSHTCPPICPAETAVSPRSTPIYSHCNCQIRQVIRNPSCD